MQALVSGERERFIEAEAAARQSRKLPPFGRLAALIALIEPQVGIVVWTAFRRQTQGQEVTRAALA